MKLNIQYFADGAVTVETINLEQIASLIKTISTTSIQILNEVAASLKGISNYDEQLKGIFGENAQIITSTATAFGTSLDALSKLATEVSSAFSTVYPKYVSEFKSWGESFQSTFGKLQEGYTGANVSKGSYSAGQYVSDVSKSVVNISQAGRTIANETVNIIANSGKAFKSTTGYSVQDVVNKSVGTMQTLMGNASRDTSVLGRLLGAVGNSMDSLKVLLAS